MYPVSVFFALRHVLRVVLKSHKSRVHPDLPTGQASGQQFSGFDLAEKAIEIGELVSIGIDREVIRIADENLGRIRFVGSVDPRPEAGMFRVEGVLAIPVKAFRCADAQFPHRSLDDLGFTDLRVKLPHVMLG